MVDDSNPTRKGNFGFTLVELLVVMAVLALLLSIAAPRYFDSVEKTKETVLLTDLKVLRDAIDKYKADIGVYPESLKSLVDAKYIRSIPEDPIAESSAWIVVGHPDGVTPGIYDVRSAATGNSRKGTSYETW